jgi:hypothetical protein
MITRYHPNGSFAGRRLKRHVNVYLDFSLRWWKPGFPGLL